MAVQPGSPTHEPLVRMRRVGKSFGGVPVLMEVDLEIQGGEVHILAGENGAGKSTLMKILGGAYDDYEGELEIGGRVVRPRSPEEANALGVGVIYQELSLVPNLSVADNIFLGRSLTRFGFVRDADQAIRSRELLEPLGVELPADRWVEELSMAERQLVEIAKVLARDVKVVVMDEPTSSLSTAEVDRLFQLIRQLKQQGCGIVYITHKMEEIDAIADRITVLRDGRKVGTSPAKDLSRAELIRLMVGRDIEHQFPPHRANPGRERLRLEDVWVTRPDVAQPAVAGVSLSVPAGEVLGIAGLRGSGASELLQGLFGSFGPLPRGRVWLDGEPIAVGSPRRAVTHRLALVTEDRKTTGLVLSLSVAANMTLAALPALSPGGWRRSGLERNVADGHVRALSIRTESIDTLVEHLSGGNQQKVVLAKWLETQPSVLLLDEPTRGVDVGAKREIYDLIHRLTAQGLAILLITSEMPELLALSDRILVMHRGHATALLSRAEAAPDRILAAAMGLRTDLPELPVKRS